MAITRRQFVTRLSTLAAAMGMSQVDLAKVTEAFAHGSVWAGAWNSKPKVVWVHGAECTGCSTSLLSLFEDVRGRAIELSAFSNVTTLAALDLAVGGDGTGATVASPSSGHPYGHRTLQNTAAVTGSNFEDDNVATIADVLIDFIDLQYHETVQSMGGDLAYQWLKQLMDDTAGNSAPFVLVVEGAVQPSDTGGYWNALGDVPWCSIGMNEAGDHEHAFDEVVAKLAAHTKCAAIVPIGQCAVNGGYPACVSPVLGAAQTGAMGTYDFLKAYVDTTTVKPSNKVINVPGCPTNPWWFVLTVVAFLVDFTQSSRPLGILDGAGNINASAVDRQRRLKAVYGVPLHGPYCKRYQSFLSGAFATKPGDKGCLQLIGCKGPQTMTLCGPHGWNAQNTRQDAGLDYGVSAINGLNSSGKGKFGGNCTAAGHPCMACTEKGYPDAFLPFVVR